jgi:diketogulonate reductase-like aldo/keto reductase
MEAAQATTVELKNGTGKMPFIGHGCWQIPADVCADVIYTAIKNGYRHIDQAIHYGNEKETGEGIKRAIDEGLVKREDLWITGKLWNTHHRKEHAHLCLKRTMDDLGVDYLDLYLVHFPISLKFVDDKKQYPPTWFHDISKPEEGMAEDLCPISETWGAMEDLLASGKVKNIGVSNFPILAIRDILSYCKVKPAVNQMEIHPFNSMDVHIKFCEQKGIHVTAYSGLGGPSFGKGGNDACLTHEVVTKIAEAKGKTPAQILLRWSVQRGVSIIPKSLKEERQK